MTNEEDQKIPEDAPLMEDAEEERYREEECK